MQVVRCAPCIRQNLCGDPENSRLTDTTTMVSSACVLIGEMLLLSLWSVFAQSDFTRITIGEIVTDQRHWHGQTWGDYDSDGHSDLFLLTTDSNYNPLARLTNLADILELADPGASSQTARFFRAVNHAVHMP